MGERVGGGGTAVRRQHSEHMPFFAALLPYCTVPAFTCQRKRRVSAKTVREMGVFDKSTT